MVLKNILQGFGMKEGKSEENEKVTDLPYQRVDPFLSPAERSFFGALELAVGSSYRIFSKVRLADVIGTREGLSPSRQTSAFNSIKSKHLDFVLCDPATLSVVLAIELDDASHRKPDAAKRDGFIAAALLAASLPLLRFRASNSYATGEIQRRVQTALPDMGPVIGGIELQ